MTTMSMRIMNNVDGLSLFRRRRTWIVSGCVITYVLVALAVFLPALPWSSTRLPSGPVGGLGSGDPAQMTWFLAWIPFALRHGLDIFHTNFIDYPKGVDLANGSSASLLGLLGAPVTLTLGPVAAFNILLRLAFASSATSMFLVLRAWCRWPAAFVGGLIYGFGPYMATQGQTHLNLIFVPIPPLLLWCCYRLLTKSTQHPVRMGVVIGLLCSAQAYIEPELLVLVGVVAAIGILGIAVSDRRALRQRFDCLVRAAVPALVTFFVLTGYLLWSIEFAPGHLVGTALPVANLQFDRADLLGPIIPTINQLLSPLSLQRIAGLFVEGNSSENATYLGVPAVLLIAYFGVRWRRDRIVLMSAVLAGVAFLFSLGSRLTIDARATAIPLPEAIFAHLPVLDNVVPARFAFVVGMFAAIALAVGGDHTVRAIAEVKSRRWKLKFDGVAAVVAMFAAVVLLIPQVPFTTTAPPWPSDTDATLEAIPVGSVVLTYPFPLDPFTEAMSWQAGDGLRFKILGGYATVQGGFDFGGGNPPLLAHPFMQEYLTEVEEGDAYTYPPPSAITNARFALCHFLSAYHVGAVVYWESSVTSLKVKQLFLNDLGPATGATRDRKVLLWIISSGGCAT